MRDTTAAGLEATIREYFDACNAADAAKIRACFEPEGVHYFPGGAPQGTFVGALATEDVRAPFAPGPLVPRFIGAADIGDISTVIFPTSGSSGAFPFAPIAAGCPI